jgi:hypothetical protein
MIRIETTSHALEAIARTIRATTIKARAGNRIKKNTTKQQIIQTFIILL